MRNRKCGCSEDARCNCAIESSDSVEITGFGSATEPYSARLTPTINVEDTDTLGLTLDVTEDGLALTAFPSGGSDVQVFNTAGAHAWVRPSGVSVCKVILVGGGGGGGGGAAGVSARWALGGTGGAPGGYTVATLNSTGIPASATVTVGAGGAFGAGGNPFGANGSAGGDTTFGTVVRASGGGGGIGGQPLLATSRTAGAVAGPASTVPTLTPTEIGSPIGRVILDRIQPGSGGWGVTWDRYGAEHLPGVRGAYSQVAMGFLSSPSNLSPGRHGGWMLVGEGGWGGSAASLTGKSAGLHGAGGGGGGGGRYAGDLGARGGNGSLGAAVIICW